MRKKIYLILITKKKKKHFVFLFLQSEKAGQISQHQLLVAMRLGNPILAAQCKVFAAFSLIQRGRLKMASRIIRLVYSLHSLTRITFSLKLMFLNIIGFPYKQVFVYINKMHWFF